MKNYVILPLIIGLIIGAIIPIQSNKTKQSLGTLTVTVRDAEGNIIKQYKQPIHSPVIQFADIMNIIFSANPNPVIRYTHDITHTGRYIGVSNAYAYSFLDIGATANRCFIGFGNGTNPVYHARREAFVNLLSEVPVSKPSIGVSSNNITITLSATYSPSNNTTITEVGIILRGETYDATDNNYADLLVVYDVLATLVNVPAGGSITVTYNFVINI